MRKVLRWWLAFVISVTLAISAAGRVDWAWIAKSGAFHARDSLAVFANLANILAAVFTLLALAITIITLRVTVLAYRSQRAGSGYATPRFPFQIYSSQDLAGLAKSRIGAGGVGMPYTARLPPEHQEVLQYRLTGHRFLLITGRTGLGKTREAIEAIRRLAEQTAEEFIVLYPHDYVDVPDWLPAEMPTRHVVLFVDDIHQRYQSLPRAHSSVGLESQDFHDRFTASVSRLRSRLAGSDFRVIVTARDEPGLGQRVNFDTPFWKQFHRVRLPDLHPTRRAAFAADVARTLNIELDDSALRYITSKSDGTPAGILTALTREGKRRDRTSKTITAEHLAEYTFTYPADWDARVYGETIRPVARRRSAFQALGALRAVQAPTLLTLVEDLAARTWGSHFLTARRLLVRRSIRHELHSWMFLHEGKLICPDAYTEGKARLPETVDLVALSIERLFRFRTARPEIEHAIDAVCYALSVKFKRTDLAVSLIKSAIERFGETADLWCALAISYNLAAQHNLAVDAARQAVKRDPGSQKALIVLSYAYSWVGANEDAIRTSRLATAGPNPDFLSWLNLGVLLSKQEQYSEAVTALRNACSLNPDNAKARSSLGVALERWGRVDEGIRECRAATELDPDDPITWRNSGIALERNGRVEEATNALERAHALDPDDLATGVTLVLVYSRSGRGDDASRVLKALEGKRSRAGKRELYLLSVGFGVTGQHEQAVKLAMAALALDANYRDAIKSAVRNLSKLARYDEAVRVISSVPENQRDPEDWSHLAMALLRGGALEPAVTAARRGFALDSRNIDVRRVLSVVLHVTGGTQEAVAALEGIPDQALTAEDLYHLSLAYCKCGKHEAACKAAERALHLEPLHPGALTSLATSLANMNRAEEAVAVLERVPEGLRDADTWYHVSVAYGRAGRHAEAVVAASQALTADPAHRGALRSKSVNLSALGRNQEAVAVLEAVRASERKADDWYYFSVALGKAGYHERAVAAARRSLDLEPDRRDAMRSVSINLMEQGESQRAIGLWEAIPDGERTADDWYYLSIARGKARLTEGALEAADRALAIEPGHAGAARSRRINFAVLSGSSAASGARGVLDLPIADPRWPQEWARCFQDGQRNDGFLQAGAAWLRASLGHRYWASVFLRLWQVSAERTELRRLGEEWLRRWPAGRRSDEVRRALEASGKGGCGRFDEAGQT